LGFDQNLQLCDIAYVGGGFGNPGTMFRTSYFWCSNRYWPTIRILQTIALVNMEACTAINNQQELNETFENLIRNEDIRHERTYEQHFV
jgi:3-deoxy-D-manno-octulosonic-acid transferase